MDSFGYFVNKAKTRVYRDTAEPNWNEVRPDFWVIRRNIFQGESVTPKGFPAGNGASTPGISWRTGHAKR